MVKKVVVKIKVKAKDESKLPDWGLGPGILAQQEVELLEPVTEDNKILFAATINKVYDELVRDTLKSEFEYKE